MGDEDTPADGDLRWRDEIPSDEVATFRGYSKEISTFQQSFADRGDGRPRRGFHVKSHIGLKAEFRVLPGLHEAARHGVFIASRSFPAWVRISNGFAKPMPDWFPDLIGLAVKLEDVAGRKLLPGEEDSQDQDFLALNHAFAPVDDAHQLMVVSLASANVLTAPFRIVQGVGLRKGLEIMAWTLGWTPRRFLLGSAVTEDFSSLTPMNIGPLPAKFTWASQQRPIAGRPFAFLGANHFREDLRARLAAGDIRFDFLAQFYVDASRTPVDGAYGWSPADAPLVKLAELVIERRDIDSEAARADESHVETLAFNPWRALAAHRPVGNIQRARGLLYQGSAGYRGSAERPVAPKRGRR